MVQTRQAIDGPQTSHSQQPQGGDGIPPNLPRLDNPTTILPRGRGDSNYNNNTATYGSQSELTKLRLEN